jgi:hypothetical protein
VTVCPGRSSTTAANALAPTFVGHADDHGVEHRFVVLQCGLDFFGIDLLAARVDAHRAATEQCHRPVGFDDRGIAGHGIPPAGDLDERGRRLLGILVVAQRHVPAARHTPDDTGTG